MSSRKPRSCSAAEAAELIRSKDQLGLPLGPGQPPALLRALGEREEFEELMVFGALLMGLYPFFTRPGVKLRSGFFGPVERGLRASGHDVQSESSAQGTLKLHTPVPMSSQSGESCLQRVAASSQSPPVQTPAHSASSSQCVRPSAHRPMQSLSLMHLAPGVTPPSSHCPPAHTQVPPVPQSPS